MNREERDSEGVARESKGVVKLRWQTRWDNITIPERIIRKLAKIGGLKYKDGHEAGGGGLCMGIVGIKARRKAFAVLGHMATHIGDGSMDGAVEGKGASWLDVEGWRDNEEFEALWCAAIRVRRNVSALRLEDRLFERAMNGYDQDEYKSVGGEIQKLTVRKFDHNIGVNILRGLGYIDKGSGVKQIGVRRGVSIGSASVGVSDDLVGSGIDTGGTVLFMDRETAYKEMGGGEGVESGEGDKKGKVKVVKGGKGGKVDKTVGEFNGE